MTKDKKEIIIPAKNPKDAKLCIHFKEMITQFKPSDILTLTEVRRLPVVLDSEGNMELIKEEK